MFDQCLNECNKHESEMFNKEDVSNMRSYNCEFYCSILTDQSRSLIIIRDYWSPLRSSQIFSHSWFLLISNQKQNDKTDSGFRVTIKDTCRDRPVMGVTVINLWPVSTAWVIQDNNYFWKDCKWRKYTRTTVRKICYQQTKPQ